MSNFTYKVIEKGLKRKQNGNRTEAERMQKRRKKEKKYFFDRPDA
jgi:hypothetical protein